LRVLCQKLAWFFLIFIFAAPVGATEIKLVKGEVAEIASIVDGDTVKLKRPIGQGNMVSDQIRLVGIQAPKLPLGRKNFEIWPLANEAKVALEKLGLGKKVQLFYGGRRMDRPGRLLAHLHLLDGTWIQGVLLAQGMARVYSFPDNRAVVKEMLAEEKRARRAKKGIWQHAFYRIRPHTDIVSLINSFQLIEGKIYDVAKVRNKIFINFGENWRTDFTIALNGHAGRLFDKAGFDPILLKGKWVRVRGWIKSFNGPMINATHPEQIEVLDK
jgi:micrococcal nuclease